MSYHVAQNGTQLGVLSEQDIVNRLASGQLSNEDLFWTDGMADWQPLGSKFRSPVTMPSPSAAAPASINPYAAPSSNVLPPSSRRLGEHPGFWRRFGAYFIDYIVGSVCGGIAGAIVGFMGGMAGADQDMLGIFGGVAGLITNWLYYALMECSASQATLGKMALGIIVTDMNGDRITFGKATGRFFGKIISSLILCIGFLMCAWTENKQCLHDMMAGCLLYKKN
jgi:uncharacterized RDD family membrane protein YckC